MGEFPEPQVRDYGSSESFPRHRAASFIRWNNEMRGLRLGGLSEQVQEYFEEYVPKFCKPPSR